MKISTSTSISVLHLSIILLLIVALLISPIAVDQVHMDDTVLLANVGWRGVNGHEPVIDYPHFYGGFVEFFVTASFNVFGVSYKVINYAFVILFGITALLMWPLCWKRLALVETALLGALTAALILSLEPLEGYQRFEAGHSFVYNHVGVALMLALTVFACIELRDRRAELVSAAAAGVVLYALVLVKATFGIIGAPVVLACLLQRRWASAGLVVAGATVAMIMLDPGMTRVLGSLRSLLGSDAAAQSGGVEGRLSIASLMLQMQAVPLAIVSILTFILLRRKKSSSAPLVGALFLCGLGYSAAMLATGGSPQLKLLPYLTVAALLLGKALQDETVDVQASRVDRLAIRSVPVFLAYFLILPATVTSGVAFSRAVRLSDASLVSEGPLSQYVVFDTAGANSEVKSGTASERLKTATANSLRKIQSGKVTDRDEYVVFADGIALLRQLQDIRSYGIVSNGRMFDFTAPLQSKVVLSYPVWPTVTSPELTIDKPLEADVDLVMILNDIPVLELVSAGLKVRMDQEFRPCGRSVFWTLFARHTLPDEICGTFAKRSGAILSVKATNPGRR